MKEWSLYFQNEEFLAKSRFLIMNRDMRPMIADWLGLRPGIKVLDVGCGTGEYTFYLGEAVEQADFTGVDLDGRFVEAAAGKAAALHTKNRFHFVQGDALHLPFEDDTFDLVVSQTFLVNIPDYMGALREMRRVCRTGGIVASCTAAGLPPISEAGEYPIYYRGWKSTYDRLYRKAWDMYEKLSPVSEWNAGVNPGKVQQAFVSAGLTDITTYPVGGFFSLSNPTISDEEKRRYLELDYLAETKKLRLWFETVREARDYFTEAEVMEFELAAEAKKGALTAAIGENRIWEWQAVTMLLILGKNPKETETAWVF